MEPLVEETMYEASSLTNTLLWVTVIVFVLVVVYELWFQSQRYVKVAKDIPSVMYSSLPVFGNALLIFSMKTFTDVLNTGLNYPMEYDLLKFYIGPKLYVVVSDPQDIEVILSSNIHIKKSWEYGVFKPWLGDGLLISNGDKWRNDRKIIAPTFHMSILKTFIPSFNKSAENVVNKLRNEIGKEFDVHDYMSSVTVDVLLDTVMGFRKAEDKAGTGSVYAKAVLEMCSIIHERHLKVWLRPDFLFRFSFLFKKQIINLELIHNIAKSVISEKKEKYFERIAKDGQSTDIKKYPGTTKSKTHLKTQEYNYSGAIKDDLDELDDDVGEKKRLAFLDFMVEASQDSKNNLTDKDLKDQVNTIMFEGHDTTAAASSFVLCLLGVYQDVQDKVYKELTDIFQNVERRVTFADILEMKYLERVILETLRLYPPVPVIGRCMEKDVRLASGYTIPKGATVGIAPLRVHRRPQEYPDPLKFNPDNFLPERCVERHYYSFIPFSAGPRSCVGRKYAMLKLKVLLATILRKYRVVSMVDEEDFKLQGDIILKRSDGFKIRIEERTH